jgi:hypothetical protein
MQELVFSYKNAQSPFRIDKKHDFIEILDPQGSEVADINK